MSVVEEHGLTAEGRKQYRPDVSVHQLRLTTEGDGCDLSSEPSSIYSSDSTVIKRRLRSVATSAFGPVSQDLVQKTPVTSGTGG